MPNLKELLKLVEGICKEANVDMNKFSFDDVYEFYKKSDKLQICLTETIGTSIKDSQIESIGNNFLKTLIQIHIDESDVEVSFNEDEFDVDKMKLDSYSLYCNDIHGYKLMTKAEEIEAFKEYEMYKLLSEEDRSYDAKLHEVISRISGCNQRLVISIARRYIDSNYELLSGIQDGNLGLLKAIECFDYKKGYKFSTYATWWIRQSINREKANTSRTIRIPVHMHDGAYKYRKLCDKYNDNFEELTDQEAARILNTTVEKINAYKEVLNHPASLNTKIGEEEENELLDFIPSEEMGVEENIINQELRKDLYSVLDTLSKREKDILILRFGLEDGRPRTLEEVGAIFHVTRERIRQIESKALRKLRGPSRAKKLKGYL